MPAPSATLVNSAEITGNSGCTGNHITLPAGTRRQLGRTLGGVSLGAYHSPTAGHTRGQPVDATDQLAGDIVTGCPAGKKKEKVAVEAQLPSPPKRHKIAYPQVQLSVDCIHRYSE
ncbi:hypothetical protein GCM10027297_33400 [Parahaliea aestuarii]